VRLWGNNIYQVEGLENLPNIKIIDLDTEREVSDRDYFSYLLTSLNKDEMKQICRENGIRGYSYLRRNELIRLVERSLSDEARHLVIKNNEREIMQKAINLAFNKIYLNENERLESITVVDEEAHKLQLKFVGFGWQIESSLSITSTNMHDPERSCGCQIGRNMGFCNHFWVGFIFSVKKGWLNPNDWTLTPLLADFSQKVDDLSIENTSTGIILVSKKDQHIDTRIKRSQRGAVRQWHVPSHSDPYKRYTVTFYEDGTWACSCPHWIYRRAYCKHIRECQYDRSHRD
jgi:hypothetical protein